MYEKCMAKCSAIWSKEPVPHLWLRGKVFYCRIELAKFEGKRRYFCYSLHTNNYYEALAKMQTFENLGKEFNELFDLYSKVKFVEVLHRSSSMPGVYGFSYSYKEKQVAPDNDHELLLMILSKVEALEDKVSLMGENTQLKFDEIQNTMPLIKNYLKNNHYIPKEPTHITIKEVLDIMIKKAGNKKDESRRKELFITKALKEVNLTLDDDYSKFHQIAIIQTISDWIKEAKVGGDTKVERIRYIKDLLTTGYNVDSDCFKKTIIDTLPTFKKTKDSERNGHLPYTNDELLKIFDTKNDFFKKEPDMFWICLIALFTGARRNAAMTLQYGDIIIKDGMYCISFNENHEEKHLKTSASERIIPIHKQLLNLGFVDYVMLKKIKERKTDEDFIFTKSITKTGKFSDKYLLRVFNPFLIKIGIKKENKDGKDFHSFRNNLSKAMQDAGLSETFINKIIGWKGDSIMQNHYSKYTLKEIKAEYEKFSYNFLQPKFDEWKKIMAKLPEKDEK